MIDKCSIMEDFNAEQAKQIVDTFPMVELHNILVDIKNEAEQGNTVLHIYKSINKKTKQELTKKGFKVVPQSSTSIQTDGLYYSIHWG